MAEYVRRRRPPANHPYWAHLHDRAHPPRVVVPIVIPTLFGLCLGLCGGQCGSFTMSEVVRAASVGAAVVAAMAAFFATVFQLFAAVGQPSRGERWAMAAVAGIGAGLVLFVIAFVGMFVFLAWYAACSGEGPWLGMLYGALIGGCPAAAIVYTARERWRARQKQWPRWERMRTPRPQNSLNLTELSTLPTSSTPSATPPAGEQGRNPPQPGSEFTPLPPIGETGEET